MPVSTLDAEEKRRQRLLLTLLGGGLPYSQQILNTQPSHLIGYWKLNEASGTVADDSSSTGADGTYSGSPTLGQTGIGDGNTSVLFDGTTDRVDLDVATLDSPFDGAAGTLLVWLKVRAASVWTDGVSRFGAEFGADANNRVFISKSSTNNILALSYRAGGTIESVNHPFSVTTWFTVAITWSKAGEIVTWYVNGATLGGSATLGVYAGALSDSFTAIGNFTASGGANFWDGYIAHVTLWKTALTAAEIALLSPAAFQT